jgi:hypothetical protein
MQFNDRRFGTVKDSLVKSPYVEGDQHHRPSPPIGDFYLLDNSGSFLLDDSDDYLVTP